MLETISLLTIALLFGGMVLYSFGFAAVLFTSLPADLAGATLRRAFPHFYSFVILTSAVGGLLMWQVDALSASLLAIIALSTIPTRQLLMPAINKATDSGDKSKFKVLHSLSVLLALVHIAVAGWVLARFV
ncbi:MAG: DUF4149 domain-containing protein [Limnobacter sp.]|nr:DUF4149 domain-containing protein [Limnobacter sp.]